MQSTDIRENMEVS